MWIEKAGWPSYLREVDTFGNLWTIKNAADKLFDPNQISETESAKEKKIL